ncbi:MAG: hypothetical protein ACI8PG_005416 [Planctomycetota bacterium]
MAFTFAIPRPYEPIPVGISFQSHYLFPRLVEDPNAAAIRNGLQFDQFLACGAVYLDLPMALSRGPQVD